MTTLSIDLTPDETYEALAELRETLTGAADMAEEQGSDWLVEKCEQSLTFVLSLLSRIE